VRNPKAVKRLSENWGITISEELLHKLQMQFGSENVKVMEKSIEKV
jgi:DNA polymerase-3 subunit alpha